MPIRPSTMARALTRVERNIPTREFRINSGQAGSIAFGYLKTRGANSTNLTVDALGIRDQDGILFIREGQVHLGDEVDNTYVVWGHLGSDHYTAFSVRKIPPWEAWNRRRYSFGVRDTHTLEPLLSETAKTIQAHLTRVTPVANMNLAGIDRVGTSILLTKVSELLPLDRVEHPVHGTYNVVEVYSYGPYHRAHLAAA